MKKLLTFTLLALSFGAFAQDDAITYTDEAIVVDLYKACWNKQRIETCSLSDYGLDVVLKATNTTVNKAGHYVHYEITSQVPIKSITYKAEYYYSGYYHGVWNGSTLNSSVRNSNEELTKSFEGAGVTSIKLTPDYAHSYSKLSLNNGVPSSLNSSLSSVLNVLKGAYTGVNRNINSFRNEIAKSHRGHLDRLSDALKQGIELTGAKDAKTGKPLYSIVDWRIQENARLIVVFGTVLNELLTDYDDVERLKTSINAMRTLVHQLRVSYGWEKGLAGTVSKASSSLIDVVRLELQELASIKIAMGSQDFQIYMDLLKVTRALQAKVDASKSGDMKAQREIYAFLDLWNGKAWQDEMAKLMNAGPDFKNLVIPKLSMLIYSIESISDLSEQDFIIPDRSALK